MCSVESKLGELQFELAKVMKEKREEELKNKELTQLREAEKSSILEIKTQIFKTKVKFIVKGCIITKYQLKFCISPDK